MYYLFQEKFGKKKTTPTFAQRMKMGFNVTISKLQYIQHIDGIP
jgi:hypothetical protein